ncbi:hypothetical protein B5K05_23555 [Rhizobium phaseoli]|uniref:hypothetical protein n=1 Tax=Rhizobium phaseoli TaxID=396 RepID=UPI0002F32AD4|nr:hypothetical protein [Rhizobium phaseoli]KKZ84099.1 hypothetical protein RPHASCH2410_PD04135 [Rhizobium phaseoli Ch24-10]RDJ05027.1 hypothetical protein B5K04_23490 [Rhizobium phaseoli]RDJ07270.1 hypothetical protein B5K05_23555 [Rhizobium phaseoli]
MFSESVASIFSMFLIAPLRAQVAERVAAAKAPIEIARACQECLTTQAPRLLERATNEVGWAISNAVGRLEGPDRLEYLGQDHNALTPQCKK